MLTWTSSDRCSLDGTDGATASTRRLRSDEGIVSVPQLHHLVYRHAVIPVLLHDRLQHKRNSTMLSNDIDKLFKLLKKHSKQIYPSGWFTLKKKINTVNPTCKDMFETRTFSYYQTLFLTAVC